MRKRVSRVARPWVGRLSYRLLRIFLRLRRLLNLRLRRIRLQPVLVPVRLNPVALSRVLLRVVVPRGIVIGPLITPRLVIGGLAAGINKGVTVNNLNLSPFVEKLRVHFFPPKSLSIC